MVDTVILYTGEFSLREGHRLKRNLTVSADGKIERESTYLNFPEVGISVNDSRLRVNLSLPKALYKTSLREVEESDFPRAVALIESRLHSAGVSIGCNDLSDFKTSRVDFCKNITVEHSLMDYVSALSGLSLPRMKQSKVANETLLWQNSVREFTLYNKVREVRENSPSLEIENMVRGLPENILRVESRLKRRRAVSRLSGVTTLRHAFDLETSRRVIQADFDTLTKSTGVQVETGSRFDFSARVALLKSLRSRRGGWKDFLCVLSVRDELQLVGGDWSVWHDLLRSAGYKRSQVFQIVKELKRYHKLGLKHSERNLVEEIKRKIAA